METVRPSDSKAPKAPGNQLSNEPKRNTITIGINLEGYDRIKEQFRNIEATLDRIIEKQKFIGIDLAIGNDCTVYSKASR
ncbi:hypothetical protein [Clostridium sp. CF012]|uniref:hypothetical protein n=1 Tax=Clostridium sp. CF012 TaxID=2843319 RepID=UPI001C0D55E6|nr:hypothetical protein [Clostridium sp. CF012]MBU3146622.1 hypothetical protein [Clostridium sp. CF012]